MRTDKRNRGFALPAVTGALVIIGILVTAGFYMSRQELRIGVASNHTNLALNIAQAGANEVMANWNGYSLGNIGPWTDTTLTDTLSNGIWSVRIMNANDHVYFLTATGEVTEGGDMWAGARRTIGITTKILYADIDPPGALTTRGDVNVGGSAAITGDNMTPTTWGPYCTSLPADSLPGIVLEDTTGGNPQTTGGKATIDGEPPFDEDSTLVDETFTDFGNLTWTELVAVAQADGKDVTSSVSPITTVGPSVTATVPPRCDTADPSNWGDTIPIAPCGAYFPLIYHAGPLVVSSSSYAQGILLVDGDLEVRGGFTFYGIIITQGSFTAGVGDNLIVGAVMASNAGDINETYTGSSQIIYSRCAVTRAVLNNSALSRARPLAERSWVDLTSVTN